MTWNSTETQKLNVMHNIHKPFHMSKYSHLKLSLRVNFWNSIAVEDCFQLNENLVKTL